MVVAGSSNPAFKSFEYRNVLDTSDEVNGLAPSARGVGYITLQGDMHRATPTLRAVRAYEDEEVADLLHNPRVQTDATIFDTYVEQPDAWPALQAPSDPSKEDFYLQYAPPGRKAYEGPAFLQEGPTCGVWATIHASFAVGAPLSAPFAKDLLNAALFRSGSDNVFALAATVIDRDDSGIEYDIDQTHGLGRKTVSPHDFAAYIKQQLDEGAALIFNFNTGANLPNPYHAVCITGYDIDMEGRMKVQVIDSKKGTRVFPIRRLTQAMNYRQHGLPLITVKKKS